jgi:hypothetical protein
LDSLVGNCRQQCFGAILVDGFEGLPEIGLRGGALSLFPVGFDHAVLAVHQDEISLLLELLVGS